MKAPAMQGLLEVGAMGESLAMLGQRRDQSLAMAGANMLPMQAQRINGDRGDARQLAQAAYTDERRGNRDFEYVRFEGATAPRDYLLERGNPTAAAELMTADQKEDLAQQVNARIREEIVAATTGVINAKRAEAGKHPIKSQLAQLGEMYGG